MNPLTTRTDQDLLPHQYVFVNVFNRFYKIGEIEPLEYDTGSESTAFFSSVAINGESGFKNITELNPDDSPNRHLFQLMFGVKYGMKHYLKIPTGTNRFGTDVTKGIGFVDSALSPYDNPNKDFQFWAVRDYYPSIDVVNNQLEPLTPKIRFTGFKYELKELDLATTERLKTGQLPYKHVTVGGSC